MNDKTIKYQLINGCTNTPIRKVYTAKVKDGHAFSECGRSSVELRRCKDVIIAPINKNADPLQPRRIIRRSDGRYELGYGWPRGKSWSQYTTFCEIKVLEINI
jgi:hypothetical protein